jgi:hypothetical protein
MDQEKDVKNAFSVAHRADEEQRREHNIEMVRDRELREALWNQKRDRDQFIEQQEKLLADERRKIADEAIAQELIPDAGMHLTPAGMEGLSWEAREKLIRTRIEREQGPIDAFRIEGLRYDLNRELDNNIEAARRRDRELSADRDESEDRSR